MEKKKFLKTKIDATTIAYDQNQISLDRLNFGIPFLDDACEGIVCDDTIVLGAFPGQGKTQLASQLSQNIAAQQKKEVHLYALEGGKSEIGLRIGYSYGANDYYRKLKRDHFDMRFIAYRRGTIDKRFYEYAQSGLKRAEEELKNLTIFYRNGVYVTIEDFMKEVESNVQESNIVILDHITYFDSTSSTQTERAKLQQAIKQIRNISVKQNIPVIAVSHLTDHDKLAKKRRIIPNLGDIFGSSDIGKECTIAIFIGRDYIARQSHSSKIPFLMRVSKCRDDGSMDCYAASMEFDVATSSYGCEYKLVKLTEGDTKYEPIKRADLPRWARRANNEDSQKPRIPYSRYGYEQDEVESL